MAEERQADMGKQGEDQEGPEFGIQRVYVKGVSMECPNSPHIFLEEWAPEMKLDLETDAKTKLDDGVYEVILTVTVTVKIKDKTAFLVEVQQAGIFTMMGFTEEECRPMLGAFCPTILYPYAREAVTSEVMRAGFPQLYLSPVNFEAMYEAQETKASGEASVTKNEDSVH